VHVAGVVLCRSCKADLARVTENVGVVIRTASCISRQTYADGCPRCRWEAGAGTVVR